MENERSKNVERSLSRSDIHADWEAAYRTPANERFYELAFDRVLDIVGAPQSARFVDLGCGPGFHSIRLARHGYRVLAVDFSPAILDQARANVAEAGLVNRIELLRENLLALSFGDRSLPYLLCWGVLMHIPEVDRAITEVSRVLAPGGRLIVSEGNARSADVVGFEALRRLRPGGAEVVRRPAGLEHWKETSAGPLMTRRADIGWTVAEFRRHGLSLLERLPCQFTETYVKLRDPRTVSLVHRLNEFWFRHVQSGLLSAGNILIFERAA